ncbi:MAG: PaaI family thioesterase, partial [Burkholderiales bacterium]
MSEKKENDRSLIRQFRDSNQKEPLLLQNIALSRSLKSTAISVDAKNKTLRMRFQPGDEYLQGRGVIQGGIVATMLDFTLAFAAMT